MCAGGESEGTVQRGRTPYCAGPILATQGASRCSSRTATYCLQQPLMLRTQSVG